MKRTKSLLIAAAALGALALAGCSTPETRIERNPAAFAALPPDQQSLVRQGRVGIGMTMEAVRLALGGPDRVTVRTDARGNTQTWHYVEYAYVEGPYLYPGWAWGGWGGWGYRHTWGWGGWGGWGPGPYWGWDEPVAAYDRFQVVFRSGLVESFSQDVR